MRIPLDPCQWASLLLLGVALTCSVSFHAIGSSTGLMVSCINPLR